MAAQAAQHGQALQLPHGHMGMYGGGMEMGMRGVPMGLHHRMMPSGMPMGYGNSMAAVAQAQAAAAHAAFSQRAQAQAAETAEAQAEAQAEAAEAATDKKAHVQSGSGSATEEEELQLETDALLEADDQVERVDKKTEAAMRVQLDKFLKDLHRCNGETEGMSACDRKKIRNRKLTLIW